MRHFYRVLTHLQAQQCYVAYSGGVDSHVLLVMLAAYCAQHALTVTAVHVHHNLQPQADLWVQHCQQVCKALGVPLVVQYVDVTRVRGHSVEEVARKLRYQALAAVLPQDAYLFTAHHADDQAETLLLQLLRGAGPKGLAGMPEVSDFAKGQLVRPLLHYTRQELVAYATARHLVWVEDSSNLDISYNRNYLRHQVIPLLQQRWPSVVATLTRTARHCAQAEELLTTLAARDLAAVMGAQQTLVISKLLRYTVAAQGNIVRYWLRELGFRAPSEVKLQQVLQEVLQCRHDRTPVVTFGGVAIRRYRDALYAIPLQSKLQNLKWPELTEPLKIPNLGILQATGGVEPQLHDVSVRFRKGGERCQLVGRCGHQQLKKLFQAWQVPVWQRERIPLIYVGEELAVIVGFGYCRIWPKSIDIFLI